MVNQYICEADEVQHNTKASSQPVQQACAFSKVCGGVHEIVLLHHQQANIIQQPGSAFLVADFSCQLQSLSEQVSGALPRPLRQRQLAHPMEGPCDVASVVEGPPDREA